MTNDNRIFYEKDCDLSKLDGKTVAIIGYGSQGHAHALNLKDSGVNVVVGLYEGSKSKAKAESQGLKVLSVEEATKAADIMREAGAKSYLVAPNTTVQLWDSESQVIYLKSADASGMPSIKVLDYTIRDSAPKHPTPVGPQIDYATKEDIGALQGELNKLRDEMTTLMNKEVPKNE